MVRLRPPSARAQGAQKGLQATNRALGVSLTLKLLVAAAHNQNLIGSDFAVT
jgi:hypothetical protein